jgi:hypothetical protein
MRKISVLGLLVFFAMSISGIAFAQNNYGPKHAPGAWRIPNMIGKWSAEIFEVGFYDPWDGSEQPNFAESSVDPDVFPTEITAQKGRRFAGYVTGQDGQHNKFTGVVTEDGTVTIHFISVSGETVPDRVIFFGKVFPAANNPRVVKGTGVTFETLISGPAYYSTIYMTLKKVE